MHGLDYVHGDIKSVRVSFPLTPSAAETSYSLTFSLTATTLHVLRILDRRLSSQYQSLTQRRFTFLWKAVPFPYGGSLRSLFVRRNSG